MIQHTDTSHDMETSAQRVRSASGTVVCSAFYLYCPHRHGMDRKRDCNGTVLTAHSSVVYLVIANPRSGAPPEPPSSCSPSPA